jgi:hypothetical protein
MFKDLNGDGIIDSRDQTFLGSPIPKFQFGINNSFNYKNFDLNIFFSGSYGNKVFNELAVYQTNPGISYRFFYIGIKLCAAGFGRSGNGSASDVNNVYVTNPGTTL